MPVSHTPMNDAFPPPAANESASARWKWWTRFSLREMLLTMTAVCGLVAAFYNHRPFFPTAFLINFQPQPVLDAIVLAKHPVGLSYGGSSSGGYAFNSPSASRQCFMTYDVADPTAEELLVVLRDAIEKELTKEGCRIVGRTSSAGEGFGFDYQKNAAIGFVWVYGLQGVDRVNIGYLAFEHR